MSTDERQPLLPQHTQHVQKNQQPSRTNGAHSGVQNAAQRVQQDAHNGVNAAKQYVPSKETRFSIARAYGALQAGKLPTTQQLDKLIDSLLESDILQPSAPGSRTVRLSDEGAQAAEDLKELIAAIKTLVDHKNGDNKIQEFLYHTMAADVDVTAPTSGNLSPRARRAAASDTQQFLNSLRTIGQLIITSPSFRSLLSEAVFIGRDIFADAAAKVAENAGAIAEEARVSETEREEGVDWQKVDAKGKRARKAYASGSFQQEAQSRAGKTQDRVRKYLDEKLPDADEAKDRLIERLKRIVIQTQKHPEYRQSIQTVVSLMQKWYDASKTAIQNAAEGTQAKDEDVHAQKALEQLKAVLEVFANGKPLDPVIEKSSAVFKDVHNDQRLHSFFSDLGSYIDRCLYDDGWVTTNRAYQQGSNLWERAQSIMAGEGNSKWKNDLQAFQTEVEQFVEALMDDEDTDRVLEKGSDLSDDLSHIASIAGDQLRSGGIGLIRDSFDVIIPRLVSAIKEIPLPRTEYKSAEIDFAIDNVHFESASFVPDHIRFIAHNDLSMTQGYAAYSTDLDSSIHLHVDGLRLHAKDISYWFHKKTGYFTYEDEGLLDVSLEGKGLSFDVTLENAPEEARETFFVVSNVKIDLSALQFNVRENDHWFLTWFGKPFMRALIEHNLTVLFEGQITSYLKTLDFRLYGLQQRAIAATNARPASLADYFRAIFSTDALPSLPSALNPSRPRVTQKGIIKTGKRGSYILAIGVDEQLFPGKATRGDYERRKQIGQGAQEAAGQVREMGQVEGSSDVRAMERARRQTERAERRREGWQSDAFNI